MLLLSAAFYAAASSSLAQSDSPRSAPGTWSIDRVGAATSAELAEWALGEASSDLSDHLIIWGGSMYVPGLLFRFSPVDVGGVCRMKTQFVPAEREGYFAFTGTMHNPDQVRLRAPQPARIGYRAPIDGEACSAWHPWDAGFEAQSDEAAVLAVTAFRDARRAVLDNEATLECVAVREPCRGLMERLTVQMIADARGCATPRLCGTFDIAPQGSRASERWRVRVSSRESGLNVRIERGARPPRG